MKILKRARKQILREGRFRSFLVYAIIEIFLVVVGILIAVSINNWNEERKNKAELENIYAIVRADILNDLAEIEQVKKYHATLKPLILHVLADSLIESDYVKNPNYAFLLIGYPEISFDQRGFNLMKEFRGTSQAIHDTFATKIIDFYTDRMLEIKVDADFRQRDFEDNYMFWKNNHNWWAGYIKRSDFSGFINYSLTDDDYLNRMANFYFLTYDVFIPELDLFITQGEEIVQYIEQRLAS